MAMLKQDQLFGHDPDNGIWGDCYRTCFANMFGLGPAEVPHFSSAAYFGEDGLSDTDRARDWLKGLGFGLTCFPLQNDVETILTQHAYSAPGVPWILSGTSAIGTNHAVLCLGGEVWHDPSLVKSGIVGPCSDGYFWCEYVTRLPS